jgi:hypothetical protein
MIYTNKFRKNICMSNIIVYRYVEYHKMIYIDYANNFFFWSRDCNCALLV